MPGLLCQSRPSAVTLPGAVCVESFLLFLQREISRHLWPLPAPRESRFLFAAHGILVHCVFFLFGCFLYYFAKRRCFLNCKSLSCLFGGVFAHRERETTVLQFLKFCCCRRLTFGSLLTHFLKLLMLLS